MPFNVSSYGMEMDVYICICHLFLKAPSSVWPLQKSVCLFLSFTFRPCMFQSSYVFSCLPFLSCTLALCPLISLTGDHLAPTDPFNQYYKKNFNPFHHSFFFHYRLFSSHSFQLFGYKGKTASNLLIPKHFKANHCKAPKSVRYTTDSLMMMMMMFCVMAGRMCVVLHVWCWGKFLWSIHDLNVTR